jgi:hypothetical protein
MASMPGVFRLIMTHEALRRSSSAMEKDSGDEREGLMRVTVRPQEESVKNQRLVEAEIGKSAGDATR